MRTFELRVYKLRTKEALDFYVEKIYPRHLNSFPLFGIEAHGFLDRQRRISSHGSSCWSAMRRAKNPARSVGGICKAQNLLTTSETLIFPTSWALNQRSSYLQQVLRSSDGKRKQKEQMNMKRELNSSILRRNSPLFWCTLVIPVAIIAIGINFILNPVGSLNWLRHPNPRSRRLSFYVDQGNSRHLCGSRNPAIPLEGRPAHKPQHSSLFQFSSPSAMGWSFSGILALRRPSIFTGELRFTW